MLGAREGDSLLTDTERLEGEYVLWTRLWWLDLGAAVNLTRPIVDNHGFTYIFDTIGAGTMYTANVAGVNLATVAAYQNMMNWDQPSVNNKYVFGDLVVADLTIDVWRHGLLLFALTTDPLNLDAAAINDAVISPNGKYIGLLITSIASGFPRHVELWEGS